MKLEAISAWDDVLLTPRCVGLGDGSVSSHPDKNKGNEEEAGRIFLEVSTAYEVLKDPETRKEYDYATTHPEDFYGNQYRYYRYRYARQTNVSSGWALAARADHRTLLDLHAICLLHIISFAYHQIIVLVVLSHWIPLFSLTS